MLPSLIPRRFAIALPLSPLAERLQLAVGTAVLLRRLHRIEPRPADRTLALHGRNDNGGGYQKSSLSSTSAASTRTSEGPARSSRWAPAVGKRARSLSIHSAIAFRTMRT